jgi:hypothetical protein
MADSFYVVREKKAYACKQREDTDRKGRKKSYLEIVS